MVTFNIIGTGFLDVGADGIGFKQDNHQWRFSDITFGRSVEFDVPATDRNKRLLGYGDDPAMDGMMLRTRNECQMVYDGGAVNGRIEVRSFKGDCFGCVFYFGANFPSDMPLSDVPIGDTSINWSYKTPVYPADQIPQDVADVAFVSYERDATGIPPLPTMELRRLLGLVGDALGINYEIEIPAWYRIVFATLNGSDEETVTLSMSAINAAAVTATTLFEVADIDLQSASSVVFGQYVGGTTTPSKGFKVLYDTDVTFPSDMPANVFIVKWYSRLGGYAAINADPQTGRVQPLAGKTVALEHNGIYFFATKHPRAFSPFYGYEASSIPLPYAYTVKAARSSSLRVTEDWNLRYNMPEMTVFDLFRSAALATGRELLIEEDGTVHIKRTAYGNDFKAIEGVVAVDEVARNVEAWGEDTRRAVLRFDSDEAVKTRIEAVYEVDNANMEGEEEHVSKFSEGEQGGGGIFISDFDGTPQDFTIRVGKPTIAYVDNTKKVMQRVPVPIIDGYEDVALNSTSVRLRLLSGEAEFFALKPQTTFVWRGMAYVWTSAEWSDGVLSLTLQKVSQRR